MQLFKNVTAGTLTFCFITIKQFVSKIKQSIRVRLLNHASRNKHRAVATQCYRNGNTMAESQLYRIVGGSGLEHYKNLQSEYVYNQCSSVLNCQDLQQNNRGYRGHQHEDTGAASMHGETRLLINDRDLKRVNGGSGGHQFEDPRG
ncbi:hypothetical protein [Pseudoalteromonas sp. JC3]|uniref:hypothetical protein n=1 Tax=Pseudoalteromonas sp. JC3 TaxID=2810196 RepID=UPI0019D1D9A1|nr:hypothetical protein [Pseudoalteromonas sp. JC3]MBR8844185.1 hypothetical protein [Pseudoalteromonas sp. JC3]WJE11089.1 hypothetical protein QSH61_23685 [Pseudoalteromonas sp. JC3]